VYKNERLFHLVSVAEGINVLSRSGGLGALASLGETLRLNLAGTLNVGIEALHDREVAQRILLALSRLLLLDASRLQDRLNFLTVNDAGDIRLGDNIGGQLIVGLEGGSLGKGAIEGVELLKGTLGPDDKATKMASGGELQQRESRDGRKLDTGNVPECLNDTFIFGIYNEGTATLASATAAHLALSGTELLGVDDTLNVSISGESSEDFNGALSAVNGLKLVGKDEGQFGDLFNAMAAGKDEAGKSRGGECGGNSIAALIDRDLAMPATISLGGGEHATTTAHVTKSSLTGAMGTTTTNTGNTSNSATGTPGFSGSLMTGFAGDGIGLTAVLGNVGVNKANDVRTDGGRENSGHLYGSASLSTIEAINVNNGKRRL